MCLWNQSSQIKKFEIEEAKKPHHIVHHKKKLVIDTEWTKSNVKVNVEVYWHFYLVQAFFFLAQVGHTHHQGTVRTNTQCEYQQEKCVQYREAHMSVWVITDLLGLLLRFIGTLLPEGPVFGNWMGLGGK